eukprot:TRINITY_DN58394_c0_g1_i1.p1 TRINITY_DN58394_c0_g1~~TRINITY_DN58394_c0_g1_i1.p1  ORF type:complete len:597 (+),score=75.55 TRINITY_DN58394_c0_g1_i1:87-1793(+)
MVLDLGGLPARLRSRLLWLCIFTPIPFFALGFPCAPGVPSHCFRATCVGYFLSCVMGKIMPQASFTQIIFKLGVASNVAASYIVSLFWCFGFWAWAALMVLENSFVIAAMLLLAESTWSETVLAFVLSLVGSSLSYFFSDILLQSFAVTLPAPESVDGGWWAANTLALVTVLVCGMLSIGFYSFDQVQKKVKLLLTVLNTPATEFSGDGNSKFEELASSAPASGISRSSLRSVDESDHPSNSTELSSSSSIRNRKGQNASAAKPGRSPFQDVILVDLIGQGSFGKVYRGMWGGATVAVKIMSWSTEAAKKRAQPIFEAQLSSILAHPCLVQTYKYSTRSDMLGEEGDYPQAISSQEVWIVLEWCDLGTFSSFCRGPRVDEAHVGFVAAMMTDVGSAGSYLHSRGVLHGDLTGNNVLLKTDSSRVTGMICKVCDFGLARILEEDSEQLLTTQLGTVTHMPPELFLLEREAMSLSPKTDVYSYGILLWQLLMGKPPYQGMMAPQIVMFIARGKRLTLPDDTTAIWKELFRNCTHDSPDERPTFDTVLGALAPEFEKFVLSESTSEATSDT